MGGGSLEVAEAIDDRVGDAWTSLPLGALPVEALLAEGYDVAKRRVDEILRAGLKSSFARPVFYPVGGGWRALAKAHIEAVGAPVKAVHGYARRNLGRPRLRQVDHAASAGKARRHARRLDAGGRARCRPRR